MSFDWRAGVVSVTDGDTVRLHLRRSISVSNELEAEFRTVHPRGVPVRLIILDTPERGQPGFHEARTALAEWLAAAPALRVETYESAGWDRLLGDVYVADDRSNTATQHMLRQGWDHYLA